MNQELMEKAETTMQEVSAHLMSEAVWASMPVGITPYQIRKLVLNDKEYPTNEAKFRQVCRELWTRQAAYWQFKDRLEDLDLDEPKWAWRAKWLPWGRARARLKVKRLQRERRLLTDELEHRIVRETLVFLDEAKRLCPSSPTEAFSDENESKVWAHRAGGKT